MNKFFLLLTLLCFSLSARAHDAEVDGIFYNLDADNKTATVTFKGDNDGSYDNEYSGDVVIPETVTYNGITYSVTSVGWYCFSDCSSLTSITIPNSVTSLGEYCFNGCSRLTSITLGNSVTSLGSFCFYGCSSLERMVVDAANPVYDSREDCNAIIHTSTNELVIGCKNSQIPNSVTTLGEYCFYYCSGLTSITIPNSVTSLGNMCFAGCSSLSSITLGNSVTSLGDECFRDCSSLSSITLGTSVTSLGENCFWDCSSLTSITIPNSVTSLGSACFWGCSSLTSITLGNSVTSLGDCCFSYCTRLTSITIPNSVTSLGDECFSYCSSIERMVVDAANPVYDSREDCNAIIHTSTNELIAGCKNSQIPNSVTSLGSFCFYGCSSLTSITIPNSVTSLEYMCFYECSGLTSITIPNSVTSLGNYCFRDCSSLTSITIPNSVTSLGEGCFYGCSSLTSITIPNSVTSLGISCFRGCSSLTSIYMLPSTPPSTGSKIFYNTPLETVYVVDEDAKKAYQVEDPWNAYEIVVMPTGIEEVETDKTAPTIVGYYDLNGKLINGKQRGAAIVRYSDGTTRKVLVK